MENKILVPFAPILVESTRSIGYSFESAISDIIDNSISAKANNVWIDYEFTTIPFLLITDDGLGMNNNELELAMTYGSKSSKEKRDAFDLGRFGLGLKTASMSQCKKLTVISKKNNRLCGATWDLDYIREKNDWVLKTYNELEIRNDFKSKIERLNSLNSGTIVLWENFDRVASRSTDIKKSLDSKIDYASSHVSLVFHRYISKEDQKHSINIFFNERKLDSFDPFMESNDKCQKFQVENIKLDNQIIKVKTFILPVDSALSEKNRKLKLGVGSIKLNQGFYIYRNMRLIIWGTWFRTSIQNELFKLARIRVDIPNTLDHIWDIDIKKSQAVLPDSVKNELSFIVQNATRDSKKTIKFKGTKLSENKDIIRLWEIISEREGYRYTINRNNPILNEILASTDDINKRKIQTYLEMVEESFPFYDAYLHSAESKIVQIQENDEEIYRKAKELINTLDINNYEKRIFIESLMKVEIFHNYPHIIERIKNEYNE